MFNDVLDVQIVAFFRGNMSHHVSQEVYEELWPHDGIKIFVVTPNDNHHQLEVVRNRKGTTDVVQMW